jgi:hypothetical protein
MNNLFGLDYDSFLSILEKVLHDGRTNNLIKSSTYFSTHQANNVLANFLENGYCFFYDKKNKFIVKQVIFEYQRNIVSMAGTRKFYIDNLLFLETVDSFVGYNEFQGLTGFKSRENEDSKRFTFLLMERDDYVVFDKKVILFKNENHLIVTPLSHFLSGIADRFGDRYDEHFSTLEKVVSDGQISNLLYSSPYLTKPYYNDHVNAQQIEFALASFLEKGYCYFYDKENKNIIKQIVVEYWGFSDAPLSGAGGRRFYIYGTFLFLETLDWIS